MKLRRILCVLISTVTVLSSLAVGASAADSDFVIEDGVLVKYNGPKNADIIIPDGVVEISRIAISQVSDFPVKSLYIPSSVEKMSYSPILNCIDVTAIDVDPKNQHFCSVDGVLFSKDMTKLIAYPNGKTNTKYTVPDTVTELGDLSFIRSKNLVEIDLPDYMSGIGVSAFSYCESLKSIYIPNGIPTINDSTFYGCTNLSEVFLSDTVEGINNYAFDGCVSLKTITLPKSINYSIASGFSNCPALESINVAPDNPALVSVDGIVFSKAMDWLVCYPRKRSGSYVVPDSVTYIGGNAFESCHGLTDIDLNNVIYIDRCAFKECTSLTKVAIPHITNTIMMASFEGCTALKDIFIYDSVNKMENGIFDGKNENFTIHCYKGSVAEQYAIDNGLKYVATDKPELLIENGVLISYSGKGGDISIPDSVTTISNSVFRDCTGLTSVTIPSSVTAIDDYAFWGCTALSSVNIPDSVTSIGNRAFRDCTSLKEITLPDSLTYIGGYIFANCPDITVHCNEGTYAWQYAVDNGLIVPPVTTTVTTTAATTTTNRTPPVVTEPAVIETTEITETTEVTETEAVTETSAESSAVETTSETTESADATTAAADDTKYRGIMSDVLVAVLITGIAVISGCAVLYILDRKGVIELQKKSSPDPEESEEEAGEDAEDPAAEDDGKSDNTEE